MAVRVRSKVPFERNCFLASTGLCEQDRLGKFDLREQGFIAKLAVEFGCDYIVSKGIICFLELEIQIPAEFLSGFGFSSENAVVATVFIDFLPDLKFLFFLIG